MEANLVPVLVRCDFSFVRMFWRFVGTCGALGSWLDANPARTPVRFVKVGHASGLSVAVSKTARRAVMTMTMTVAMTMTMTMIMIRALTMTLSMTMASTTAICNIAIAIAIAMIIALGVWL